MKKALAPDTREAALDIAESLFDFFKEGLPSAARPERRWDMVGCRPSVGGKPSSSTPTTTTPRKSATTALCTTSRTSPD